MKYKYSNLFDVQSDRRAAPVLYYIYSLRAGPVQNINTKPEHGGCWFEKC